MTVLIQDIQKLLGVNGIIYNLNGLDCNIAIANNNNGAAVDIQVVIVEWTGSRHPALTIPQYASEWIGGVNAKQIIVTGNGANISIVVTTVEQVVRIEPVSFVAASIATMLANQGARGTSPWRTQEEPPAVPTTVSGLVAAPGINAVIADTGVFPLSAFIESSYDITIVLACLEPAAAGHGMMVEHRNTANTTTLKILGGCSAGDSRSFKIPRYVVAQTERIRVIAGGVAGIAASQYIAFIMFVSTQL